MLAEGCAALHEAVLTGRGVAAGFGVENAESANIKAIRPFPGRGDVRPIRYQAHKKTRVHRNNHTIWHGQQSGIGRDLAAQLPSAGEELP